MIYLDNAATTFPKPVGVTKAVTNALRVYGANPGRSGHEMTLKTSEEIYKCRKKAAEMFGANSAQDVAFTLNCTHALNMAIKGAVKPGCHVITSNLEHNSVIRPLYALKEKGQLTMDIARVTPGDDEATVEAFRSLIRPNTSLIVCTHVSNVFGIVLPVGKIGELAASCGITFIVDAAQSAGMLPLDIQKMNIDYLCMPGHKGLYGPMGTGMLISTKGDQLATIMEGGTGSVSQDLAQPDFMPDRLESGTVNTAGIIGLSAGLDFVKQKGMEKLYHQELYQAQMLYDGITKIKNTRLYLPRPFSPYYAPVLSFNIEGAASGDIGEALTEKGIAARTGLHCAPMAHNAFGTLQKGTVRLCPSAFTTRQEIERTILHITKIAKSYEIAFQSRPDVVQ